MTQQPNEATPAPSPPPRAMGTGTDKGEHPVDVRIEAENLGGVWSRTGGLLGDR